MNERKRERERGRNEEETIKITANFGQYRAQLFRPPPISTAPFAIFFFMFQLACSVSRKDAQEAGATRVLARTQSPRCATPRET